MSQKHEQLLDDLEFRINQLMYVCDSLKEENLLLKSELEQKDRQLELSEAEIKRLNIKCDNLKIANTMMTGGNAEDAAAAKVKLTKLIQDVEKCITLLKV